MVKHKNKILKWLQFRTFLLIGVGILLWIGFQWMQKSFIAPSAVNDSQLAAEVLAEIGNIAPFDLLNIQAKATGGHVVLLGKVRSKDEKEKILEITRKIKDVKSVTAKLDIDSSLRTPEEVKEDSLLVIKIKSAIAVEEGLRVFQIKVNSYKGIITLEGEVPFKEHRTLAERVAKRVNNVKQVINKINLKNNNK